jgi:hypothetical protein
MEIPRRSSYRQHLRELLVRHTNRRPDWRRKVKNLARRGWVSPV